MAKIYYEDEKIGEVTTNSNLTIDEALDLIGFDEGKFIEDHGYDSLDPNDFTIKY